MTCMVVRAADAVTIVFDGATASVTIPEELSLYVTCSSGTSSHVKLIQAETVGEDTSGEITYSLSGETEDGEFYLEGGYKCTISLAGVTLTNPTGPAIDIENGKRIKVAAVDKTVNTLADGTNGSWKACIYGTGHFEFVQKGTINVTGNSAHAISCKEYMQFKNQTLNINGAKKDGIHCQQYFWMQKAGKITITGAEDDGIQVELTNDPYTGQLPDHEDVDENGDDIDENSGNAYLDDGTLIITEIGKKAIKTDGQVIINGGTQDYDADKVSENNNEATGIRPLRNSDATGEVVYDLNGRQTNGTKGIAIIKNGNETKKVIVK